MADPRLAGAGRRLAGAGRRLAQRPVARAARGALEALVRAVLDERRAPLVTTAAELARLRSPLLALEREVEAALVRADRRPLGPDLSIHAAHARHPDVRAVFARHGLPDCPSCPAGADETLGEAAFAEGFDLDALIAELRALGV